MSILTDNIPAQLPVTSLSASSISLLRKCPEKWRRRYILGEYEPTNSAMFLGSVISAAETQADGHQIDNPDEPLPVDDVLDAYAGEWSYKLDQDGEPDWGDDKPGEVKDKGVILVREYERIVRPLLVPLTVERQVRFAFPGAQWAVTGYLDLEVADIDPFTGERHTIVVDRKVKKQRLSQADADADAQAAIYLAAKRAEGEPADGFRFDTLVKTKTPQIELVSTQRTDAQLDAIEETILAAAAEIAWRTEFDVWTGAPQGAWWCGQKWCGHWRDCKFGGAR